MLLTLLINKIDAVISVRIKVGGLDLDISKSQSQQFEKGHLDRREILDNLKKDILTNLDKAYAIKSRFVSLSRSRVSNLLEYLN